MRKAILVGVMAAVFSIAAGPAWADLDEKDVAKAVQALRESKAVVVNLGTYPGNHVVIFMGAQNYTIDLRAQLCFAGSILVPCKALKKGYPLVAPLITWDD